MGWVGLGWVGMDCGFGGMEENKKSASPKKNCGYIKAISREP